MQIRLPHLLSGMALLLLGGLAAVVVLESRSGGASVPGLVLFDQPSLAEAELGELARGLSGARVEWVPAGSEALSPFTSTVLERHRELGYFTALLAPSGEAPPEAGWQQRTHAQLYRVTASQDLIDLVRDDLGLQIRSQRGTRPFVLALVSEPIETVRLAALGAFVRAELSALPSYRRSSLVILGARQGGRRLALRLDIGPWSARARDALTDLLEPGW